MAAGDDTNADDRRTEDLGSASSKEEEQKDKDEKEFCTVELNGTPDQADVNLKLPVNAEDECSKINNIDEKACSVEYETIELPAHESLKLDNPPENTSNQTNGFAKEMPNASSQTSEAKGSKKAKSGSVRHIMALLALSSIVLANMNRQAFNQALVSMTKPHSEVSAQPIEVELGEPRNSSESITDATALPTFDPLETITIPAMIAVPEYDDRYDWTGAQIGTLQAAFSYGYAPFMIPGGRLSELYGAKWVVFVSGFGSALCCILSPFLADTNYIFLVASRVVMGKCEIYD